ncbi:cytosolic phospholipase A2 delta-like [Pelobates cultripes]|uniref:Phospholipase A2 n=1 Tax=Pelobates cultripes TaxID=61616 RepID=A0AAD1TRN1_PELCU|nr:cytosolic phospholipase A2 delta-like [Pelobates cultripes]
MADKHSHQEESTHSRLSVTVIQAKNIPWADWTTNADCYVSLWLPSSTNKILETKTISNSSVSAILGATNADCYVNPSGKLPCVHKNKILETKTISNSSVSAILGATNADCYVSLWLPSSTNKILETKTISNSSEPRWNETFHFKICDNVKNMLYLALHDEDTVSKNDLLYTVAVDVENLDVGKPIKKTFPLNPEKGKETLEVEFTVQKLSAQPEKLLTNGVLVSRAVSCLDVCIDMKNIPENVQGKRVVLAVEDSSERTHKIKLSSVRNTNNTDKCRFHCIRKWDPELIAHLEVQGQKPEDADGLAKIYKDTQKSTLSLSCIRVKEADLAMIIRLSLYDIGSECVLLKGYQVMVPDNHMRERTLKRHDGAGAQDSAQIKSLELNLKASHCPEKLDMRMGFDLCDDEKIFLQNRSKVSAAALKKVLNLERDLQADEVPVIAVTTTGGGARAMTALYGSLSGLKKMSLLDTVSYITGASGSTWTVDNICGGLLRGMCKLYEDPDWSHHDLARPIQEAQKILTSSKLSAFSFDCLAFYRDEMKKRAEMGYKTSVTDLWGLVIESILHDGINDTKLSDQRKALNQGQNPLPLYLAMNVKDSDRTTLDFKEWCEFSPYEVGLFKYGTFIRSEDFGSEFFMGQLIKKLPESRLCYLQGLWSNIFSINLMDAWFAATTSENFWERFTKDNVQHLDDEEALAKRREDPNLSLAKRSEDSTGAETRVIQPSGKLSSTVRDILTKRPIDGDQHNFLKGLQIHKDYVKHKGFTSFEDTKTRQCPNELTPFTDSLCLVDSAYYINASFPSLLREERKVDVILSFDYCLSRKFLSVEQTQTYCARQKIPFPKIQLSEEEKKHPKECVMFYEPDNAEAPIILHFPLVADTFQDFKEPGVKRSPEEHDDGQLNLSGFGSPYHLLNLTYSDKDFDKLVKLTEYNVMNNEKLILQAVRDAIAHKQKSRDSGSI